MKYIRGAAGIGLGAMIKYRAQCLCTEPELSPCATCGHATLSQKEKNTRQMSRRAK
jgi:hypothetical protein